MTSIRDPSYREYHSKDLNRASIDELTRESDRGTSESKEPLWSRPKPAAEVSVDPRIASPPPLSLTDHHRQTVQ